MASWLKAAEDLFEVVDRRAKLVVSELADEQNDSTATNVQGSKAKRTKSRAKANRRPSTEGPLNKVDTAQERNTALTSQSDVKPDKDTISTVLESNGSLSTDPESQTNDQSHAADKDAAILGSSSTEKAVDRVNKRDIDHAEVPIAQKVTEPEDPTPAPNVGLVTENAADMGAEHPIPSSPTKAIEEEDRYNSIEEADLPVKIEQSQSESGDVGGDSEGQVKDVEQNVESSADKKQVESFTEKKQIESSADKKQRNERKGDVSSMKLEDQLDEAQMLLKNSTTTGQSKEARLTRVCNGLATRLQEYKSENAQLEELLVAERELTKSYEARTNQLQNDLSVSKKEATRIESSMAEALAAKNSEIEALSNSMEALKKQLALSEGNLASMQANMDSLMRNRELTETRMMQALREELASAERRAEEERTAHNATKKAAMEREVELEHRAVEASTALARTQRLADERTAKAAELEQKLAFYEVENSSLAQELQDVKALARRGQKKSAEETNQAIQAWQEEAERARQGHRDAESKLSTLEVEMQKMRVEMAAMKRDAEHYSRQEHMELEKRYRELTDLLYYKQTQLEAMASEKAAAEFQLEKELKRLREVQIEVERSRVSRRASTSWEEDSELKALEPLPLHHGHMAAASVQLQKAAKLLDSGAVRATRFLWRYPTARVLLLFYLVFVHLFLMYLLHRLQEQADNFSAREVAESMGLATPNLP
ncbi:golgin candidate 1 isoform X2 [Punica granatum]|uniref:Golgin candidate 1 isoform X2 n=1 Tax=Punica granatum TaxID=22663 RepID=A0A6P8D0N0_PUNGR|nr:golgin candidate 1 isoform X2 [Punica granatum]